MARDVGQDKTILFLHRSTAAWSWATFSFFSISPESKYSATSAKRTSVHHILPLQQPKITTLVIIKSTWAWPPVLASQSHYLIRMMRCNHHPAWAAPITALTAAARKITAQKLKKEKVAVKWRLGWGQQLWEPTTMWHLGSRHKQITGLLHLGCSCFYCNTSNWAAPHGQHHHLTAEQGLSFSVPFDQNAALEPVQAGALPCKGDTPVARLFWSCSRSHAYLPVTDLWHWETRLVGIVAVGWWLD